MIKNSYLLLTIKITKGIVNSLYVRAVAIASQEDRGSIPARPKCHLKVQKLNTN